MKTKVKRLHAGRYDVITKAGVFIVHKGINALWYVVQPGATKADDAYPTLADAVAACDGQAAVVE